MMPYTCMTINPKDFFSWTLENCQAIKGIESKRVKSPLCSNPTLDLPLFKHTNVMRAFNFQVQYISLQFSRY